MPYTKPKHHPGGKGQANPKPKGKHKTKLSAPGKPKPQKATTVRPKKIDGFPVIPVSQRGPGQLHGKHYVVFAAYTFKLQVRVLLGANGGQISAGYGTYTDITRPRNVSLLSFTGRTAYEMTIDVVFNGMPNANGNGKSVEQPIADLETLAIRGKGMISPPQIKLFGPVPHTELEWVITAIDWGDAVRRNKDGVRLLQYATVTVHEWLGDPYLKAARPAGKADGVTFQWYALKKTDDLKGIAKRLLGKPSYWPQIVAINPGMHGYKLPQPHFKVGDRIRVPKNPAGKNHTLAPAKTSEFHR
jgi:hypothetical protein